MDRQVLFVPKVFHHFHELAAAEGLPSSDCRRRSSAGDEGVAVLWDCGRIDRIFGGRAASQLEYQGANASVGLTVGERAHLLESRRRSESQLYLHSGVQAAQSSFIIGAARHEGAVRLHCACRDVDSGVSEVALAIGVERLVLPKAADVVVNTVSRL